MKEFREPGESTEQERPTRSKEMTNTSDQFLIENSYEREIRKARDSYQDWMEPLRELNEQRAALLPHARAGSNELERLDAAIEEMEAKRHASIEKYLKPNKPERLNKITDADVAAFDAEVKANLARLRADHRLKDLLPPTYDPYHGRTPSQYLAHFARGRKDNGEIKWEFDREAPGDGIHWKNEVPRTLDIGNRYCRFSHSVEPKCDEGNYLTITGTGYEATGLHAGSLAQYQEYVVRRPIHAFRSEVTPGSFGTGGRGGQLRLELPVCWYVEHGFLEPVGPPHGKPDA